MIIRWLVYCFIIVLLCLAFIGCAPIKGINSVIFLTQRQYRLYNSKNEDCITSGYQITREPGKEEKYRFTTYFSNCDTWESRYLEESELKHWILPITPKKDTYAK